MGLIREVTYALDLETSSEPEKKPKKGKGGGPPIGVGISFLPSQKTKKVD